MAKSGLLNRLSDAWQVLTTRQSPENPSTPLSAPASWLFDTLGGLPTLSGSRVNERTALQISAVYACVQVISQSIGSLPLHVFRRLEPRGREKAVTRREYYLLHDSPNDRMSAAIFREVITAHTLLWGNGYALIERDGSFKVKAMWPLMSDMVRPGFSPNKRLVYEVTEADGSKRVYFAEEILHIAGFSFDGINGQSPIRYHREGIGLAQALEAFGSEYFGQGTSPSGVLQVKGRLSDPGKERLEQSWRSIHAGRGNRHKVPILEEDMEFKPLTLQADHAQFIESRKFQIAEIARVYRVPLHLVGDLERATNNNIEHQSLEFVEYTLRPWLVRWEQELNRKLFGDPNFYVEHNVDGLLRGDFQTRMAGMATGRQWGWLSANDVRDKENMNPLPGKDGDQYLVPMNMTTPELIENPPKSEPAPAAAAPMMTPGNTKDEIKQYLRPLFADAIRRSLHYETKDPAKLERFVGRAFAPVMVSMAEMSGADVDLAIRYSDGLHERVASWAQEKHYPAPMVERELELAFNFIAAKESTA